MTKNDRIATFVEQLVTESHPLLDPCYLGFFRCFNQQRYYEAHDVLEHLWLQNRDTHYAFYKGLIQLAGAFVHLQKQLLRPDHPKDGRRLHPAVRLFALATTNLESYQPQHLCLDVTALCTLCRKFSYDIVKHDFQVNPWNPASAPRIDLELEK